MLRNYIEDKSFYRWVLSIALPIVIQNVITTSILMGQMLGTQIAADRIRDENRKRMTLDFSADTWPEGRLDPKYCIVNRGILSRK